VCDLQLAVQFGMPGACSQGLDSLVPGFESEPLAAMKKQLLPLTGALAGQPLEETAPDIENDVSRACQVSLAWVSVVSFDTDPDGALRMYPATFLVVSN
jgi:hypothetical protein